MTWQALKATKNRIMSQVDRVPVKRDDEDKFKRLTETILDTIVDGVITIDARGTIQSYNKACVELFGYAPEEVLGQNVKMLMPTPYRTEHDSYLSNYQNTGQAKVIGIGREVSGQRKDGSVFPMELAVGDTDRGGEHAFVGVIRDLSERKEAEKAQEQLRQSQKMESLGQLTGGIAHDFNNLLAVILGNLDLMLELMDHDDPLCNYLRPAIEASEHGAELTKQLLAFGRKHALQPKLLQPNELLENLTAMLRRSLGERVKLVLSPDTEAWLIYVDPTLLQNALLNLSVNARDAMPEGGKLIFETKNVVLDDSYALEKQEVVEGDYVMITVSDTGTGMNAETAGKAFEPFYTTKEVGKGSGLGLSMVYGFVKQSNGHIQIYSELGMGTTIKIYLPRHVGEDEKVQMSSGGADAAAPEEKNKRILVVEDNPDVLALTSAIVSSLGYDVVTAECGDDAVKILEARGGDFDLLLSDVMLPGEMNGPEVAKFAKAKYPGLKVLFNSGYAEHALRESGLLEEGVNLIGKPFRKKQLAKKIEEVLSQ